MAKKPAAPIKKLKDGGKAERPVRKANARGLDRTKLAEAKTNTALKSMSDRFDNPKGQNAGLTLSQALGRRANELNLFDKSTKLYKERDAIRNKTKRDVGDKTRR
jgi:hypothetical protein